jgi:hypothetical protein
MPRHYSQTIEINAPPAQVWPAIAEAPHKVNVGYLELEANGLKAHCEALAAGRTPPGATALPWRAH